MSTLQIINLKHPTATSNNITFSNTGDVGIGSTNPQQKLDVVGLINSTDASGSSRSYIGWKSASPYGYSGLHLINVDNSSLILGTNNTARASIDVNGLFAFNSGFGSVGNAYGCRAWVNYNAQANSIRASQGVTSITKNATGDYTVNLNFTMPDINYSYIIGISSYVGGTTLGATPMFNSTIGNAEVAPTTTTFRFATCVWNNGSGGQDAKYLNIIVVR